jgi:hypothetical protein
LDESETAGLFGRKKADVLEEDEAFDGDILSALVQNLAKKLYDIKKALDNWQQLGMII